MTDPIPDAELDRLEAAARAATPGRWYWNLNLKSRCVCLESTGIPAAMRETVMDFVRWGMGGAAPRFRKYLRPNLAVMVRVDEHTAVVPGREHHADWFRTIDHPDAAYIAALNPTVGLQLLAEVRRLRELTRSLADRCERQSEALSRRAERQAVPAPAGVDEVSHRQFLAFERRFSNGGDT